MEPLTPSMTREQRLLFDLLSSKPAGRPGSQDAISWDDFLRLAVGLGLSPFLAYLLQEGSLELPDPVREQILERGRANTRRQLRRLAALRQIAAALEGARIPLMVLKGMALAYLAYPNPYCRSMADVDLLVRRADLEKAGELVCGLGFRETAEVDLMERFRPENQPRQCFSLVSSDGQVQVEIHAYLRSFAEFGINSDSLWDRSLLTSLGGVPVRVPCPEDFIQHLCLHIGAHDHYFGRLQGLLDFRFYLERYGKEMDWQAIADHSLRHGTSAWIYLTLWLAQELLGAPVPADFFQAYPAPKYLDDLIRLATYHLQYVPEVPVKSSFVKLFAARSSRERWRALAEHWSKAGPRVGGGQGRKAKWTWLGDYFTFALHRLKFYVRAGILRPSVRNAAAECQASRARLLDLMASQGAGSLP